jgi:hypothetical protein
MTKGRGALPGRKGMTRRGDSRERLLNNNPQATEQMGASG